MRPLRPLTATVALLCALALSACADTSHNRHADNEGIYVDVGPLKYQVQLSRQLNPYDTEDSSYLVGLPAGRANLAPDKTWFGVFVQVINRRGRPAPASTQFFITDTQDHSFAPTPLANVNPFAYRGGSVAPYDRIPASDSAAGTAPTQGGLILFELPIVSFDNRPLILHIVDAHDPSQQAIVDLDV